MAEHDYQNSTTTGIDWGTHVLVDLYNALDQQPSSVYIHERLLEVWKEIGDEGKRICFVRYQHQA